MLQNTYVSLERSIHQIVSTKKLSRKAFLSSKSAH